MADPTDRRAQLAAAFDAAAKEEIEETTEAPVEEAPAVEEEAPAVEAAADDAPEGETPEEKATRERDEKGRFTKEPKAAKPKVEAKPAVVKTATPAPKPAVATATPAPAPATATATRPPQSWTAQAREAWKDVPPAAQQEIHRLEGETRRVLQENAGLRKQGGEAVKYREGIESFVRPFEGIFRARGQEPMQGVANVVQTYAALHYGAPQQKAAILAQLIGEFSTVDDVNAVLSNQTPAQTQAFRAPPPPQREPVDVRAAVREEFQTIQQQALTQRAERDWESFQGANPEFLPDVQDDMQALLDSAASRGRNLTYQQAYDLACKMNEGVQGIIQQRKAAEAATAAAATPSANPAQRARAAAATVRSRPATTVQPAVDPNDRRAMLERQWNTSE